MAFDSQQIGGFRLARDWKQVREGLSTKRVIFSSEGRQAEGRAVKIEPGVFNIGLPYRQACVEYDFGQHSILKKAANFKAPSGLFLPDYIGRLKGEEPDKDNICL